MYVLGSYYTNDCEVLDTNTPNASFQPLAKRPQKLDRPIVCVHNTDVYLMGGFRGRSKRVQKYSTTLNTWTVLPELKHKANNHPPCFGRGNNIHIFNKFGKFMESFTV